MFPFNVLSRSIDAYQSNPGAIHVAPLNHVVNLREKMKITNIKAFPISYRVPEGENVRLGIGLAVKRDAVLIKVETSEGVTGWGESHHGRCPGAIAKLIDTTIKELVVGMDALDNVGVWDKIYRMQLASHGMGYASTMALSGLDLALWDIKGQALNRPLFEILGGSRKNIPAYAGGIALGWQEPAALAEEAMAHLASGYKAIKLRVGDNVRADSDRVEKVRECVGDDVDILVDANTGYSLGQVRKIMPLLEDLDVGWLEEPFPAMDFHNYRLAATYGGVPIAAGENHFTRYEFARLIEDAAVSYAQPDLSKTGGMTEAIRIAALTSAWKIPIHPHTSLTGINMAASIHLLSAIDNGGYFEGDVTRYNPFRDDMGQRPFNISGEGFVSALEEPGIGITINEKFLAKYPLIEGPCYV